MLVNIGRAVWKGHELNRDRFWGQLAKGEDGFIVLIFNWLLWQRSTVLGSFLDAGGRNQMCERPLLERKPLIPLLQKLFITVTTTFLTTRQHNRSGGTFRWCMAERVVVWETRVNENQHSSKKTSFKDSCIAWKFLAVIKLRANEVPSLLGLWPVKHDNCKPVYIMFLILYLFDSYIYEINVVLKTLSWNVVLKTFSCAQNPKI